MSRKPVMAIAIAMLICVAVLPCSAVAAEDTTLITLPLRTRDAEGKVRIEEVKVKGSDIAIIWQRSTQWEPHGRQPPPTMPPPLLLPLGLW